MNGTPDIHHLVTKNWFYALLLGSLLVAANMSGSDLLHLHEPHHSPLRIIPAGISVLVSALVLSLPAFIVTHHAITFLRRLSTGRTVARYSITVLLLVLVWGTGVVVFPLLFHVDMAHPVVFETLCLFTFSTTYFFTSDEYLLGIISTGGGRN